MFTLNTFYKSKEWRNLVTILKHQRLNSNGDLICSKCGKPIIKAYDCIGHHKLELTNDNVNNYSISLNPDNIELIHFKCHNKEHKRFGYVEEKTVYLVYGAPLSGKTSWVKENANSYDLVVDMDSIYECISINSRYTKPNRLNENAFAVRNLLLDMIKTRRGKWGDAYVIGGYPLIGERERLCRDLNAEEVFINTSKEECLLRLSACKDRNINEWTKYIKDWFDKSMIGV